MRLAKGLIRLRICAGWSEALLVAHTTLLEISCHGSFAKALFRKGKRSTASTTAPPSTIQCWSALSTVIWSPLSISGFMKKRSCESKLIITPQNWPEIKNILQIRSLGDIRQKWLELEMCQCDTDAPIRGHIMWKKTNAYVLIFTKSRLAL